MGQTATRMRRGEAYLLPGGSGAKSMEFDSTRLFEKSLSSWAMQVEGQTRADCASLRMSGTLRDATLRLSLGEQDTSRRNCLCRRRRKRSRCLRRFQIGPALYQLS